MRRHPGIRTRIAGGSFAIAALFSLIAGLVINAQVARIAREGTEAVLTSDIAPYLVALQATPIDTFDPPGPSQLVAVIAPDGTPRIDTLPTGLIAGVDLVADTGQTVEVGAGTAERYLVRTEAVTTSSGVWHVVSARSEVEEETVLVQMRALLFGGLAVIVGGVAGGAWLLTSASLGPVRRIRRTAEEIMRSGSDELLPVGRADDEVTRLAHTLNELIEELRTAADRERQLVSDASHELRTPLAILRTQLELATARPGTVESLSSDIAAADASAARLQRLLESLLELSRIEAEPAAGRGTTPELVDEVRDAVDRVAFRAPAGIEVVAELPDEVVPNVAADAGSAGTEAAPPLFAVRPADLGRIADNLIGNALRAMGGTGTLRVSFTADATHAVLEVGDTGGGLDPAFLPRARDRFSRADPARTGDGAGLGLAIVAAIVDRAGGELVLDNDPGVGLCVRVTLPAVAGV